MEPEKPLHVLVAEALGWFRLEYVRGGILLPDDVHPCRWKGVPPGPVVIGEAGRCVPRYDTDWSATGPLIEKYGITLLCDDDDGGWVAGTGFLWHTDRDEGAGFSGVRSDHFSTPPLIAVCHLLIELGKAGKLGGE